MRTVLPKWFPYCLWLCLGLSSCAGPILTQKIDLYQGKLTGNAIVRIDGKCNEEAWKNAAVLPFGKTAEAKFIWNDNAIYGFVTRDKSILSRPKKELSVSVAMRYRKIQLLFGWVTDSNELTLKQYRVFNHDLMGNPTQEITSGDSAGKHCLAKTNTSDSRYSIEFSMPWSSLGLSSIRGQEITVRVGRPGATQSNPFLHMNLADRFFSIFTDGQKVGYSTRSRIVGEKEITYFSTNDLEIKSGGTVYGFYYSETSIETPDGRILGFDRSERITKSSRISNMERTVGVKNAQGVFDVTVTTNGSTSHKTVDFPNGVLTNTVKRHWLSQNINKEGQTLITRKFNPESREIDTVELQVGSKTKLNVFGREKPVTKIITITKEPSGNKTTIVDYIDDNLEIQKTVYDPNATASITLISSTRQEAVTKNSTADIGLDSYIPSPVKIKAPNLKIITYHLVPKNGMTLEMPVTDNQTVINGRDGSVFVTVKPVDMPKGIDFPYKGNDKTALQALKPTSVIQCDDKRIVELARKAVGNTKDAGKAARKIESFVYKYIRKKSFVVDLYTAVDIAEVRKGTCTEHSILTAALCRSIGIPCRIIIGSIYNRRKHGPTGAFVRHAWNEAYISDKWVGLDSSTTTFFGLLKTYSSDYIALRITNDSPHSAKVPDPWNFDICCIKQKRK